VLHQYWPLSVTIPAGTAPGAPVSASWPMTQGWLQGIDLDIPAGHNGTTGLKILYQGTQIVPWSLTTWLVLNRPAYGFTWNEQIMAVGLTVQAYNTGQWAHTVFLRAQVIPVLGTPPGVAEGGSVPLSAVQAQPRSIAGLARRSGAGDVP
jgi:hypothetical protein